MAITNLTNTKWVFKEKPTYALNQTFNINFTSNGENFTSLKAKNWGQCYIDYGSVYALSSSGWANENYRTIIITDGADVENADLIAFLEANTLKAPEFTETKTALKIYEDLTAEEYEVLEKDSNSFYLVNENGVYKGEKKIASFVPDFERSISHFITINERENRTYITEITLDSNKKYIFSCYIQIKLADGSYSNYILYPSFMTSVFDNYITLEYVQQDTRLGIWHESDGKMVLKITIGEEWNISDDSSVSINFEAYCLE